jgi:3-oxoacyl-[acyl-carrier protein] reductase
MIDLSGRHALVTGASKESASKEICRATALALTRAGADVTIRFGRDEAGTASTLNAPGALGRRTAAGGADLARWDAGPRIVAEAVGELGPLDVAVVNHGSWKGAAIDTMTEVDFAKMLDVNPRGTVSLVRAAPRQHRQRPAGQSGICGEINRVSSTAGQRSDAGDSHHAATEGAVIGLTQSLSSELGPVGILVNSVAPGRVDTPVSAPALSDAETRAPTVATFPLGCAAHPNEIGGPIAFLASELETFVSGEVLDANGGAVLCG